MKPERIKIDFNSLMEQIDKELIDEKIPIHSRPIEALGKLSEALGKPIRLDHPSFPIDGPKWETDDIALRLNAWFEDRYGSRLKVRMGPGRFGLALRGAIWLVHIAGLYGRARVYCSKVTIPGPKISTNGKPVYFNALDQVSDLPDGFRDTLIESELKHIQSVYIMAHEAFFAMDSVKTLELVEAALSDHASCVSQFTAQNPHFGQAKWDSLQATEKMLKAYLFVSSVEFPRIHELLELAELAESHGLETLSRDRLSVIQCSPGIRYGEFSVSDEEAIKAHHLSLGLSGMIAKAIMRKQINSNQSI